MPKLNWSGKTKLQKLSVGAYVATVVFAILFLWLGSTYVNPNTGVYKADGDAPNVATVERIIGTEYQPTNLGLTSKVITFEAKVEQGSFKGRTVVATQRLDGLLPVTAAEVAPGNRVVLALEEGEEEQFVFSDYHRVPVLEILGIAFVALLILFGRREGVNTVLSLTFTVLAIFFVFVPSILKGLNIYWMAGITCTYVIVVTLMLISGLSKKTVVAAIGCIGGLAVSGGLTAIMTAMLHLTGAVDEDSVYLLFLDTPSPIDLKAVIFAAILIGAMGAVMDVAMSLASSLREITIKAPDTTRKDLIKSGFTIGRDMLGTMSNTLVLAYIGCSLSVVLLLVTYNSSFVSLLNKEMIVVEILQALVGSLGILSAVPITTCTAAYFYVHTADK